MRTVFMGTPQFAVPSLAALHSQQEVVAVVTQPDSRQGRGQKYAFSPVKKWALQHKLPVLQPEQIADKAFQNELKGLQAELFVVVAYGQKIPPPLLEMPELGCINVHASLLPRYRGAAPIHAAIINGDDYTGVTTMYLNPRWDAGEIIFQSEEPITEQDTAGSLHDRLMQKGAQLLKKTVRAIELGVAPCLPQDERKATYAPKLSKKDGRLNFQNSAQSLERLVRALNPWPGAYVQVGTEEVKIWQAALSTKTGPPGRILEIGGPGLLVGCQQGSLYLQKLQRPNARLVSGLDFANGLRLSPGDYLNRLEG